MLIKVFPISLSTSTNNMKRIFLGILTFLAVLTITSSVKAVFTLSQITVNPTRAAIRLQRVVTITQLKKDNALKEINRRITALNGLINKINALTRLSSDEKATLTAEVTAEITSLNNLSQKITNDTDLATLTADKKSIVDSYRVFLLFMPKIEIISHADMILDLASLMQAKNPPSDAAAKITDAINQASSAITEVINLDPSGWPGNKSDLESARSMLQVARQDLNSAWQIMKTSQLTPMPTLTPTPTI